MRLHRLIQRHQRLDRRTASRHVRGDEAQCALAPRHDEYPGSPRRAGRTSPRRSTAAPAGSPAGTSSCAVGRRRRRRSSRPTAWPGTSSPLGTARLPGHGHDRAGNGRRDRRLPRQPGLVAGPALPRGPALPPRPRRDARSPSHVRRLFRHRLGDARLATVEREFLGVRRVDDVAGWEIPGRYLDFLRGGSADPFAAVVIHNEEDMRSLARLLAYLDARYEDRDRRGAAPAGDLVALARGFTRERRHEDALGCLEDADAGWRAPALGSPGWPVRGACARRGHGLPRSDPASAPAHCAVSGGPMGRSPRGRRLPPRAAPGPGTSG
jgi:hypothetical protein